MATTTYEERLAYQRTQYADTVDISALPAIFGNWSGRYVAPGLQELYGTASVPEVYLDAYRAARQPGRTTRILSIGCGDGDQEIDLAQRLLASGEHDFLITGADLAPILLDRAREAVSKAGLTDKFELVECDLNSATFDQPFDVMMANQSLHHIQELETLYAFIHRSLSDYGVLATCDMIGRNGHQRWPETAAMVRKFWPRLTEKQRFNVQLKRPESPDFLDFDCSDWGFEGIRSQDVLPELLKTFYPRKFLGTGGFIDVFIDRGFGHGFDPKDPADVALIDEIGATNEAMLETGEIKPTMMFAQFVKRPCTEQFYGNRSARRSVREPDPVKSAAAAQ